MGYKRSTGIVEHCVKSLILMEQKQIYECETAKEAWDRLVEVYQGKGMHRFLSLMKRLTTMKLHEGKVGIKPFSSTTKTDAFPFLDTLQSWYEGLHP
jgi:gag-polypeptide of LTR copia-type